MESGNEGACQQQNDRVDDQKKDSQGQDANGKGQEFEKESQGGVQEANNERSDQRGAEARDLKPRNNIRCDQQCDGAEKPDEE